eukprot:3414264-Pleurochrysis_carterae.AAC.2
MQPFLRVHARGSRVSACAPVHATALTQSAWPCRLVSLSSALPAKTVAAPSSKPSASRGDAWIDICAAVAARRGVGSARLKKD